MVRISKVKQTSLAAFLLTLLLFLLSSCSSPETEEDILTQTVVPDDKIPVTILVKYAFSINGFEKAAEEKFPELDIIQVGNYTSDRGLVEYERRLEHDDLTDIVMTWPLEIGEEYWEDRLIDLSGMSFTGKYNTSMLNKISKDGKLYYLPGPAQVRGIVYNKTLFKEKGWNVPKNYKEFVALCKKIEESGMRSLQLGFGNSEVLDTAFVGYSYGNGYSTPGDAQWISKYNEGEGSFADHFMPALKTFEEMTKAGIWKASDLDVTYADREEMLFTRKCAMAEDSVLMARMGYEQNGCTDEFALMPFFNKGTDNDWARLYMVCYIGMNKHLEETGNKEKYDLIKELMEYISTPEGQEALSSDTGAMYSSVNGVPAPNIPEIELLLPALSHGRYAIFPELRNAQNALRLGLAGMLKSNMKKEDVVKLVDKGNLSAAGSSQGERIGTASKDFSLIETGNFITDTLRSQSGADIALFMDNGKDGTYNGKGVSGKFYKGEQTEEDIVRIFPDLKHNEKGVLQIVEMTGKSLIQTLEYSIPVDNNKTGWFYYFSGLRMKFDPTAAPGKRIKELTDVDGKEINLKKTYTIAVMDQTVPEKFILSCNDTNLSIIQLLTDAIKKEKTISPSLDGRFTVVK